MFAQYTRLGVVEDDELDGLVDPAVAQSEHRQSTLARDGAVPQGSTMLYESRWLLVVEAQNECRGVDSL